MAEYALVKDGAVVRYETHADPLTAEMIKHLNGVPMVRPVVRNTPAYDPISQVLEDPSVTVTDKEVTVTRVVRAKRGAEIEELRRVKYVAIQAEAQARISERVAGSRAADIQKVMSKQINFLQRGAELLRKGEPSWSATEAAESTSMTGVWSAVKATRARSNVKEAEVGAMTDPIAINAYDVAGGWS